MSEHITDSLTEILTTWTLDQAAEAHDALNYIDAVQHELEEDGRRK